MSETKSKFECSECRAGNPCKFEFESDTVCKPSTCPYGFRAFNWQRVEHLTKETIMTALKKYIIAVGSEEISREVQEALFRAGFGWSGGEPSGSYLSQSFLMISAKGKSIMHGSTSHFRTEDIKHNNHILISSQEVIADPFQLDGATKPTREMTMEDLEDHFGEPIKITKKK